MSHKRGPTDDASATNERPAKKHMRRPGGFSVGPANLPDGTYKRKVDKIKRDLITKAKIKKDYAKVREQELAQPTRSARTVVNWAQEDTNRDISATETVNAAPTSTNLHPERTALIESSNERRSNHTSGSKPRQRPVTYSREEAIANRRRAELEAKQRAREEADRQRQQKADERERYKRAMAKARGKDGTRKLGRESQILLERVRRVVARDKKV
jgi:hypothetical protein